MAKICGFLVVRKPEYASTDLIKPNVQVDGKIYHGVDRFRWSDFESAYYAEALPPALSPIWEELYRDSSDFSGLQLLKDYEKTKEVLRFSGEDKSEIIGVWSPELEEIKGAEQCDLGLEYIGIDCFSLGEWSALLYGAYLCPNYFAETVSQLNQWGLLSSDVHCMRTYDRYLELSRTEIVEPLMDEARATNVRVFKAS